MTQGENDPVLQSAPEVFATRFDRIFVGPEAGKTGNLAKPRSVS